MYIVEQTLNFYYMFQNTSDYFSQKLSRLNFFASPMIWDETKQKAFPFKKSIDWRQPVQDFCKLSQVALVESLNLHFLLIAVMKLDNSVIYFLIRKCKMSNEIVVLSIVNGLKYN